jgi:hypothetical protein
MTPATAGEVDDLLEPVWSGPERTMLANPLAKGCLGSRAALPPQIARTMVGHPQPHPNPSAALTAEPELECASSLDSVKAKPSRGLQGCGSRAASFCTGAPAGGGHPARADCAQGLETDGPPFHRACRGI